jgi:putative salt-induced outer membrane protein YdiY
MMMANGTATALRTARLAMLMMGLAEAPAAAQAPAAPPAPPPVWAGSVGAGLAVTSGNADTSNFNLAVAVTHDPANPHVLKGDALYLRGSSEGELIVNRSTFGIRDEYALNDRLSVFGQFRYLRDTFKRIDYLIAPTGGVAYKLFTTPQTQLVGDVGLGLAIEKNPGLPRDTSGALTVGEGFTHKLTETATITQAAGALWKLDDPGDGLYTFGVGLSANLTTKTTLKVELLETFKSRPPLPTVKKQDVSIITSLVYAFERR